MKTILTSHEEKFPTCRAVLPRGLYLQDVENVSRMLCEFQSSYRTRCLDFADIDRAAQAGDQHLKKLGVPKCHAVGSVVFLSPPAMPRSHSFAAEATTVSLELAKRGWRIRRIARQRRWAEPYGKEREILLSLSWRAQQWLTAENCTGLVVAVAA